MKKFLIRHLGNMGDHVFFIPPVLATLKRVYPGCHITLVTAWGYKTKGFTLSPSKGKEFWGKRNQGGFCIHLMMTNPHVDELIHWHDTKISLEGGICVEDGKRFPTWSRKHYERQKTSGEYDGVFELDFGLGYEDNPVQKIYEAVGLPQADYSHYKIYFADQDREIASAVMRETPRPRIVLLEGLENETTRGWDPGKIPALQRAIQEKYKNRPIWFGSRHISEYHGRPLTLRENIATLALCDAAIGVMSGPMHFAAAVGLPTLALYADQPLHRAAPAFFLNRYIPDRQKYHRTLLGPSPTPYGFLKRDQANPSLTPAEKTAQNFQTWQHPGRQSRKTGLAAITVDEVMTVLHDMLPV
ncbi:MAG: glycosyltransferase family 9 protein [Patescibacteria group bacterium]